MTTPTTTEPAPSPPPPAPQPWTTGAWTVFDTETTGRDPRHARLVTATVATLGPQRPTEPRTWLVDPGVEIPAEATAIHGVTTDRARAEGTDPAAALLEIRDALYAAWDWGQPVIAFNAVYDLTLLDRELRRHGHGPLDITGLVVDSYVLDRELDPYRRGQRTLTAMCTHYGVRLDAAHDATADAVAAARILWVLLRRFPQLACMDPETLMGHQAVWHDKRQGSFADYLRAQGRDASDVNGEWPLRAHTDQEET